MKKLLIIFIAAIATSSFVSCDYDQFESPNYISFEDTSLDLAVQDTESESFEVTLYTANITGDDRTFDVNVDETSTLDPATYAIPETVTVPANSNETTITIDITGEGINNSGDLLVLNLGQEDDLYTGQPLTLNIEKLCDLQAPIGMYNNNSEWFEAEYAVEIEAGAAENEYVVKDLFADGTDITFTINEDFTISVPTQNSSVSATYGQVSVTGRAGSRIQPCSGTISLVLQHTVAAGSFGTFTETFTPMPDSVEEPGDGEEDENTDEDESEGDETGDNEE